MAATGYTPISLYYSTTASAVPTAGNLANGELALNIADMKLYAKNSAGTVTLLASNAATTPISPLTANGVVYVNGSSLPTSGSALTFDGTNFASTGNITSGGVLQALTTVQSSSGADLSLNANGANRDVIVKVNGTEQARFVGSTGSLGIGTSSLVSRLTVKASGGTYATGSLALVGSSSGTSYITNAGGTLYVSNDGSTDQLVLNSAGNLGLGVTPSAWASGVKALQVGSLSAFWQVSTYSIFSNNVYYDSGGNKYLANGLAAEYAINAGTHQWYTAASGTAGNAISFTEALTLQNVSQQNLTLRGTNASMVINSTNGSYPAVFLQAGGTSFAQFAGDSTNLNVGANGYIAFQTSNLSTERARISAAGGFSVGTTADPGAGAIYATGAITAFYSDARLKTVSGKIENALDKVAKLSGVYYTNNDTAKSFGYTSDEVQVGVLAQEIEAVLPQVVKAAPFDLDENGNSKSGQNYKTVQYEKLVPLLIEAINELRAEVTALKGTI